MSINLLTQFFSITINMFDYNQYIIKVILILNIYSNHNIDMTCSKKKKKSGKNIIFLVNRKFNNSIKYIYTDKNSDKNN